MKINGSKTAAAQSVISINKAARAERPIGEN
jgi:hypothetical protein